MAAAVRAESTFDAGAPRVLFETRVPRAAVVLLVSPCAVSAEGQRLLIQTTSGEATSKELLVEVLAAKITRGVEDSCLCGSRTHSAAPGGR